MTGPEFAADIQRSRLSPNPACGRRERRSQSIPAELAPVSTANPYADPLPACPQSLQAPVTDKVALGNDALSETIEIIKLARDVCLSKLSSLRRSES